MEAERLTDAERLPPFFVDAERLTEAERLAIFIRLNRNLFTRTWDFRPLLVLKMNFYCILYIDVRVS